MERIRLNTPPSPRCSLFAFGSLIVLFQCIFVFRQDIRIQQQQSQQLLEGTNKQDEFTTSWGSIGRGLSLSSCRPLSSVANVTAASSEPPPGGASISSFDWNVKPIISTEIPTTTWEDPTFTPKRPINFVHIPKNGGSSVVQAGIDAGLLWGDCLFQQHWPGRSCPKPPPPLPQQPSSDGQKKKKKKNKKDNKVVILDNNWTLEGDDYGRVWWHMPISQLEAASKYNPYQLYELFAIIRNPYDRAISEFYYHCDAFPNLCKGITGRRASRVLNRNIQKACKTLLLAPHKSVDYFYHWGHWIPQYDFFFHRNGKRLIDHLLHQEYLDQEFTSLMKAYSLNITLPHQSIKKRNTDHRMTIQNLTLATIKLIEVVYENDFEIGGYEMWSPKLSKLSSSSSYNALGSQQQQQQQEEEKKEE